MRYTVHFIDDRYCEKTVKSESPREAAKIFFTQNFREYDCRINTGKGVFSAKELFPDMEFLSLDIEIVKLGCELNFNQLDLLSKDILYEIYKHYPDWLICAKHDEEWKERFNIEWKSPFNDNPTMWVSTAWADYYDLTVGFSSGHFHMAYDHRDLYFEEWINKASEYLGLIKSEKLIYYETKGLYKSFGLDHPDFVKEIMNKGKIKRAYSWLGTYNYP